MPAAIRAPRTPRPVFQVALPLINLLMALHLMGVRPIPQCPVRCPKSRQWQLGEPAATQLKIRSILGR